ncbi:MAG TPA: hypothetical protein DCF62_04725 [Porticoccaceae bacterium]|nr:hypothetical protein [Porticoccaceae bacterium]
MGRSKSEFDSNTEKHFKNWVLMGGLFNCIVALPLSLPFTCKLYIELFNHMNALLGMGGFRWIPPTEGANLLFLNTAGLALFLVGMMLIYASKNVVERAEIPLLNGIIRFAWGITATYYIIAFEVIHIMLTIVAIDVILASIYMSFFFKNYKAGKAIKC